jgi:hypothetical protein
MFMWEEKESDGSLRSESSVEVAESAGVVYDMGRRFKGLRGV